MMTMQILDTYYRQRIHTLIGILKCEKENEFISKEYVIEKLMKSLNGSFGVHPTMVEYVERMTGEKWVENAEFAEAQTQLHLLKEL